MEPDAGGDEMTWLAVYLIVLIAGVLTIAVHLSDIKDELKKIRKIKEKEQEK
jgi:hypothetical protein